MATIAGVYATVAERIAVLAVGNSKLTRVDTDVYDFSQHVINKPDLEWATKHKKNYAAFLETTVKKYFDDDVFDPFLDPCPAEKLLVQRLNEEVARLQAHRLAKTRLVKPKFVGIDVTTPLVSYDPNCGAQSTTQRLAQGNYCLLICLLFSNSYIGIHNRCY